jgi:hypothetical protein
MSSYQMGLRVSYVTTWLTVVLPFVVRSCTGAHVTLYRFLSRTGGGAVAPSFTEDVLRTGVTIGVVPPTGFKFIIEPPKDHTTTFIMDLRWCSSGEYPWTSAQADFLASG